MPEHEAAGDTEGGQSPAAPEPEEKAEEKSKQVCSCALVEKYKKPMTAMLVILLLILNTIMVVVGIIQCYSSPCPIEAIIPIFLLGTGIVGIVARIILIIKHYKKMESILLNRIFYGVLTVELFFLILGSCWIFINFKKKQYSCNGAAFTWAFLILIFYYIILLSPIFIPCCIESYRCFVPKRLTLQVT